MNGCQKPMGLAEMAADCLCQPADIAVMRAIAIVLGFVVCIAIAFAWGRQSASEG
jgi:hypothetical protein